eukprot:752347-Hanusia_phi.AAC.4
MGEGKEPMIQDEKEGNGDRTKVWARGLTPSGMGNRKEGRGDGWLGSRRGEQAAQTRLVTVGVGYGGGGGGQNGHMGAESRERIGRQGTGSLGGGRRRKGKETFAVARGGRQGVTGQCCKGGAKAARDRGVGQGMGREGAEEQQEGREAEQEGAGWGGWDQGDGEGGGKDQLVEEDHRSEQNMDKKQKLLWMKCVLSVTIFFTDIPSPSVVSLVFLPSLLISSFVTVDAKKKGVKLVAHYSKFINVEDEFQHTYPRLAKLGTPSFIGMAEQLDVHLDSLPKDSLQFCRSVSSICIKMIEDGASFTNSIKIPDDYDGLQDEQFRDLRDDGEHKTEKAKISPPRSRRNRENEDEDDEDEGRQRRDRARKHIEDRPDSLQRGREGDCSEERRNHQVNDRSRSPETLARRDRGNASLVVKCRGLPYSASVEDVKRFFTGIAVEEEDIVICLGRDGRPRSECCVGYSPLGYAVAAGALTRCISGDAFVKFVSGGDMTAAVERDRAMMGRRYVSA